MGTRDKVQSTRRRAPAAVAMAAASMVAAGCASNGGIGHTADDCNDAADVEVKVVFDGGCAVDVTVPAAIQCREEKRCFRVSKERGMIRWSTEGAEPPNTRFAIFFDPLMGPQYVSNPKGCLRKRVNGRAPLAAFKYTIQTRTEDNDAAECAPLDPKLVVTR